MGGVIPRPEGMRLRLLRSYGHGTGHAVLRFPLLNLIVNDLSDFSTARSLLTPSMESENETHRICAAAIVQGVLQQTTAVSTMVGRIYSHHPSSGFPLKAKESPKKPNRLSGRLSWNSISRRITSTDDNLRFRHAYRPDEL
jgi:hypothetical protein